jgi:hypothetical protein
MSDSNKVIDIKTGDVFDFDALPKARPAAPPQQLIWIDCSQCERPGHVMEGNIKPDRTWTCRDCLDPSWRTSDLPPGKTRRIVSRGKVVLV